MDKNIKNIHVIFSPLNNQSRMIKEVETLRQMKYITEAIFIGVESNATLTSYENISLISINSGLGLGVLFRKIKFLHRKKKETNTASINSIKTSRPSNRFILPLIVYSFKLIRKCLNLKPNILNCHSAEVLIACCIIKYITKCKLIYEPHELESHKIGDTKFKQKSIRFIEKIFIKYADEVIVVSGLIKNWYQKSYKLKDVYVIRNTPMLTQFSSAKSQIFRDKFSIKNDEMIFIYQGVLSEGRSIEMYLDVFSNISTNKHIIFMGYGEYENLIKKFASKYINIHFQDAVKTEEISIYTSSADIGLHVAENKSLSYYYSLPNKFFEYIHANLPVIVSEFPEMVNVLNKYECGWAVAPENQNEFKNLVLSITFDDINKKSNQLRRCAEDFSWQKESEIYRTIYL